MVGGPVHAKHAQDAFYPGETKGCALSPEVNQGGGRPVDPNVDGHDREQTQVYIRQTPEEEEEGLRSMLS